MRTRYTSRMKLLTLPYCEECGGAQIAHAPERYTLMLEGAITSLFGRDQSHTIERHADRIAAKLFPTSRTYRILRALARLRLGAFRAYDPEKNTRALALKEGADALGITLETFYLFGLPVTHIAEYHSKRALFKLIPRPEGTRSAAYYAMDDKEWLKRYLLDAGIPCAAGGAAQTLQEARAIFKKIGRAVITKPHCGSRGRHTTIKIKTEEELVRGFNIARELSPKVIVEAYLEGVVHRVTLVGGKVAAVAKREYPYIVGDGTHTVAELIDIENQNPRRDGVFFKPLEKTSRLSAVLDAQGSTPESIPEAGARIYINDKNSRLNGTVTDDVTEFVHPENIALFERLASVLDDPIVGVDFMIKDIAIPWDAQEDAGVLECNSMPFIDVHHKVASGKPINVAKLLWEEVFRG
jgi:D-alanine-D-alanine ligase-like ATP-grasp enzyme